MATSFNEIAQEARAVATVDRAKLAETLLESLHARLSEIETAWLWPQEIEKRIAAFDRSETPACSAEDVSAAAVEYATARTLAFPFAGSPATKNARRVFLKDFPSVVAYRPDAYGITVFAPAHRSRWPSYWQSRTRNR